MKQRPNPKKRRRGRVLLAAAAGMAAAGFGLMDCGKCNGFCGSYGFTIDCDGGDRGSIECTPADAGLGDGG